MLNNCEAKGLGCVLTLPIYRGREQHGNGREAGDKGTGSGRVRYGRREVLTPLSPPTNNATSDNLTMGKREKKWPRNYGRKPRDNIQHGWPLSCRNSREFKIFDATVAKTSLKIASSSFSIYFALMSVCLTFESSRNYPGTGGPKSRNRGTTESRKMTPNPKTRNHGK